MINWTFDRKYKHFRVGRQSGNNYKWRAESERWISSVRVVGQIILQANTLRELRGTIDKLNEVIL